MSLEVVYVNRSAFHGSLRPYPVVYVSSSEIKAVHLSVSVEKAIYDSHVGTNQIVDFLLALFFIHVAQFDLGLYSI